MLRNFSEGFVKVEMAFQRTDSCTGRFMRHFNFALPSPENIRSLVNNPG